jgi:hypothetical protein
MIKNSNKKMRIKSGIRIKWNKITLDKIKK